MVLPVLAGQAREVGGETPEQPYQLEIAAGFLFQLAARADAIEVAVDIQLEEVGRVIGWAPGLLEDGVLEAETCQIKRVGKGIQEADGVVLGDVLIQRLREQGQLVSVGPLDVIHRWSPRGQRTSADLPCITPDFSHSLSPDRGTSAELEARR